MTPPTIKGITPHQAVDGSWWVGNDSVHHVLRTGIMQHSADFGTRLTDAELAKAREFFGYVRFERGHWGPRPR